MTHEPIPMRLVYVVPFFPYPPNNSGSIRVWHTLRALAACNDVRLVIQADPPGAALVDPVRALVRGLTFVPPRPRAPASTAPRSMPCVTLPGQDSAAMRSCNSRRMAR